MKGILILILFVAIIFLIKPVFGILDGLIINEIELNPPSGQTQWVELYNPTSSPILLENPELLIEGETSNKFSLPSGEMIQSGSYHVIQFGVEGVTALDIPISTIVLQDKNIVIDTLSGLHDEFEDDKTWQRFPDGIDTRSFEDWTFRQNTKGENNGNVGKLVAECYLDPFCWGKLDVFLHKSHLVSVEGQQFSIGTFYDSTPLDITVIQEEKRIYVRKVLSELTLGEKSGEFIHITIPKEFLSGQYSVSAEGLPLEFFQIDNETHSRLAIRDISEHRTFEITGTVIVPEFPFGTLILIGMAIFLTVLISQIRWADLNYGIVK